MCVPPGTVGVSQKNCCRLTVLHSAWPRRAVPRKNGRGIAMSIPRLFVFRSGDAVNKKLVENGMQLIEYDAAFCDRILALDGIGALYDDIDKNQIDGLGTLLLKELNQ